MTMGKHITRLTPATCEDIQARMLEACRRIAADHGLAIESAGWRDLDAGYVFEPVFRVSIPAPDGSVVNLEKDMFAFLAPRYGLAGANSTPAENDSGLWASIRIDRNIPSPSSASPIGEDSNSPPKTLSCY